MDKEVFEKYRFDENPIFDEDFFIKNMASYSCIGDAARNNYVFRLNEKGQPCFCTYINEELVFSINFSDMNCLKSWLDGNIESFKIFRDWMEEFEKRKARVIDIRTKK